MNQTKLHAVPPGTWGGEGVRVVVEKDGVKFVYGCASGEIRRQLKTDKKGNFNVEGFHNQRTPGPTRVDAAGMVPAHYEGKITGKMMKFKITLTDTNELVGEFTVENGKAVSIKRCH